MAKHQDLTGRGAVHPFAFVGGTDPSLDPENEVAPFKAWIDTASGNVLKIRNESGSGWVTIIAGSSQVSLAWVGRTTVEVTDNLPPDDWIAMLAWHLTNYV